MAAYEVFSTIWSTLFGYKPTEWGWKEGTTPLSTTPVVLGICIGYLITIFSIQYYMKNRPPFSMKTLVILHNYFLSGLSLVLLILIWETVLPKLFKNGPIYSVCSEEMFSDRKLELLYYLNYLVKYYELIDTLFLVLKKKPLEFLHVYHHSMTAILCWTQLNGNTTVQWVPISLNLFVHVVMYYYYARTAAGHQVWWKKHLTTLQITQFVVDLAAIYFCYAAHYSHKGYVNLVNVGDCHGSEWAAHMGVFVISSYLYLFIEFFTKTYKSYKSQTQKKLN